MGRARNIAQLFGSTVNGAITVTPSNTTSLNVASIALSGVPFVQSPNTNAVALGPNTYAVSTNTTSVGYLANAASIGTLAVGYNARANQNTAVSVGSNTNANGIGGLALGAGAQALSNGTIAIGGYSTYLATANGVSSIAIGGNTFANAAAIAIGQSARASGYSVALGWGANTTMGLTAAVAIGQQAAVLYNNLSLSIGYTATAHYGDVAIGQQANAYGSYSTVVGASAYGSADSATAFGYNAGAIGANSTAIGRGAWSWNDSATAIGYYANSYGTRSLAVGSGAQAIDNTGISVGANSYSLLGGIAIGSDAFANTSRSIAIGHSIQSTVANTIVIGGSTDFVSLRGVTTANGLIITGAVTANGGTGTSGQVLTSNGSAVYWSTVSGGGGGGGGYTPANTDYFSSNTVTNTGFQTWTVPIPAIIQAPSMNSTYNDVLLYSYGSMSGIARYVQNVTISGPPPGPVNLNNNILSNYQYGGNWDTNSGKAVWRSTDVPYSSTSATIDYGTNSNFDRADAYMWALEGADASRSVYYATDFWNPAQSVSYSIPNYPTMAGYLTNTQGYVYGWISGPNMGNISGIFSNPDPTTRTIIYISAANIIMFRSPWNPNGSTTLIAAPGYGGGFNYYTVTMFYFGA